MTRTTHAERDAAKAAVERNLQALAAEIGKHHHDYDYDCAKDYGCSCGVDLNGLDPDMGYEDGPAWHARHLAEALAEAGW